MSNTDKTPEQISLEKQIFVLEQKLSVTPELIRTSKGLQYNPSYFAIKGKIKNMKESLPKTEIKGANLAWVEFLGK